MLTLDPHEAPVLLETSPSGAEVVLDGRKIGNTPTVVHLEPGKHREIRLDLSGFPAVAKRVEDLIGGRFAWEFTKLARWRTSVGGMIEATPVLAGGAV